MHQQLTKHGRFCKQDNQLPTESPDELEHNSIMFNMVECTFDFHDMELTLVSFHSINGCVF